MNRLKIAQYIAGAASVSNILGIYLTFMEISSVGGVFLEIGILAGIVSYFFGGFRQACSIALKIAKWGWVAVPFPYDLTTFVLSFFISIYVFIFIPFIPVRKAYKESV